MFWRTLIGIAVAVATTWVVLVVFLVLSRPKGSLLKEVMRLLPDTLRLLRRLATDRTLPRGVRVRLWLLFGYLAMPIDLIPDFIPVIGYADDAILVAAVLRSVVRRAGTDALRRHWPGSEDGLATLYRVARLADAGDTAAVARSPIATGVLLAVLAAVAFGVTTPVVAWAGRDLGPLTTAALLYAGAAGAALLVRLAAGRTGPALRRGDAGRLLVVAICGAAIAPTLLAWGLQRAGATAGALLLNLEAVFTVLLARAVHREPIGVRVAIAVAAMATGGAALTIDAMDAASWGVLGAVAVAGATAAWALDNTLTRPLSEREPLDVVAVKAAVGAALTGVGALAWGEPRPGATAALVLLACGATGYGLSLRFYLLAQRRIGAGRTGSVFALAPFVGAALAWGLGDRSSGPWTLVAIGLFTTGVYLHATESHGHPHVHPPMEHDHAHRHDDGHHDHAHVPPFAGEHSHAHQHESIEHAHEHAPDIHHGHDHEH